MCRPGGRGGETGTRDGPWERTVGWKTRIQYRVEVTDLWGFRRGLTIGMETVVSPVETRSAPVTGWRTTLNREGYRSRHRLPLHQSVLDLSKHRIFSTTIYQPEVSTVYNLSASEETPSVVVGDPDGGRKGRDSKGLSLWRRRHHDGSSGVGRQKPLPFHFNKDSYFRK